MYANVKELQFEHTGVLATGAVAMSHSSHTRTSAYSYKCTRAVYQVRYSCLGICPGSLQGSRTVHYKGYFKGLGKMSRFILRVQKKISRSIFKGLG